MTSKQLIFKTGCWNCKKAREDEKENYDCPKFTQHFKDWEKQQDEWIQFKNGSNN